MSGLGTLSNSGDITIHKPAGATVRRAILFAATTGFTNSPLSGQITLDGTPVTMGHETHSGIESYKLLDRRHLPDGNPLRRSDQR